MAGGLLNQVPQPQKMQQVLPGRNAIGRPGLLASGGSANDRDADRTPIPAPTANVSQFEQEWNKKHATPLDMRQSAFLSAYMRDRYGIGSTDMQNEEEELRRSGYTMNDIRQFFDQDESARGMVDNALYNISKGMPAPISEDEWAKKAAGMSHYQQKLVDPHSEKTKRLQADVYTRGLQNSLGSINQYRNGNIASNDPFSHVEGYSGNGAAVVKGVAGAFMNNGLNALAKNITSNQYMASAIVGGGKEAYKAAMQGDYSGMAKSMFSGAAKGAINKVVKGLGVGPAAAANIVMSAYQAMKEGKPVSDALADSALNTGVSLTATAIGAMLGGPIGSLLANMAASALLGSEMYSQGIIGDAFDSRTNEAFRDAYEDMNLTKDERQQLNAMANSTVNQGSMLAQLERTKGLGMHNVGGAVGSSTGTGGGYNKSGGGVTGL